MSSHTSRRRLLAVLRLSFGGPANASVWNWWPLVVWAASAFLGVFGTRIPNVSLSRSAWIAVFLGVTALLLLRAAYRLHAEAYPDFPDYRFTPGPLWGLKIPAPKQGETELILFDVDFTNRQAAAKVHLSVDLYWIEDARLRVKRRFWFGDREMEPWGPHRIPSYRGPLGTNKMLDRPAVVGPHDPVKGLVAFEPLPIPGLKIEDNDLIVPDHLRFVARLKDDISGAETEDIPLRILGSYP